MSLLRLLSAGKSLVGLKDANPPYRMGDPRAMPKFGSGANPFRKLKAKERAPEPVLSPPPKSPSPAAAVMAAPVAKATTTAAVKAAPVAAVAKPGWRARLSTLWPIKRLAQPRVAPLVRPAIQGELSLDRVKVMRNDLSDADLEIVPALSARGPTEVAPGLLLAPEPGRAEAKRLVEAGKD